jgi:hypothetical protein
LLELLNGHRWQQVINQVQRHLEEAHLQLLTSADEGGTTVLHEATMNNAPIFAIDA